MLIAGVDPGSEGCVAFLDAETRRVLNLIDIPMSGSETLVRELINDIEQTLDGRRVGAVFIEQQNAFAKKGAQMGATSAFNLGGRYWVLRTMAACFGWPAEIVPPQKWQKHFGIAKADKERSLALASQLMPEDCGLWTSRRGFCTKAQAIGRCEAALIALYGVRLFTGIAKQLPPGEDAEAVMSALLDRVLP